MRKEIKFRTWHTETKKMSQSQNIDGFVRQFVGAEIHPSARVVNQNIVYMISTGMFDKNDVEIYEGDILAPEIGDFPRPRGVLYSNKFGRFILAYRNTDIDTPIYGLVSSKEFIDGDDDEVARDYIITGNIYEN
jgi:hypothetical protein